MEAPPLSECRLDILQSRLYMQGKSLRMGRRSGKRTSVRCTSSVQHEGII